MAKGTIFQTDLISKLKDPKFAANYITAAMEENDYDFLAQALSDIVKAHGTSKIAKSTHLGKLSTKCFLPRETLPFRT